MRPQIAGNVMNRQWSSHSFIYKSMRDFRFRTVKTIYIFFEITARWIVFLLKLGWGPISASSTCSLNTIVNKSTTTISSLQNVCTICTNKTTCFKLKACSPLNGHTNIKRYFLIFSQVIDLIEYKAEDDDDCYELQNILLDPHVAVSCEINGTSFGCENVEEETMFLTCFQNIFPRHFVVFTGAVSNSENKPQGLNFWKDFFWGAYIRRYSS